MSWRYIGSIIRQRQPILYNSFPMFVKVSHQKRTSLPRTCTQLLDTDRCAIFHGNIRHCSNRETNGAVMETTIEDHGKRLSITTKYGHTLRFPSVWLRFNCHCPNCKQPHTLCKVIDPTEVNIHTTIESAMITKSDEMLTIHWDDHKGEIPFSFLRENHIPFIEKADRYSWIKEQTFQKMSYHEVTSSKSGFLRWLRKVNEEGWCLLTDVPKEENTITTVAERVGPIYSTVYGDVFQVFSEPNSADIACTSVQLPCHMDSLFYESPPGVQFLHCIRFDDCVDGGDSIILNVFNVAEIFRNEFPDDFEILTKVPAVFQNIHFQRENPICMAYQRPHIVLNDNQEVPGPKKITHVNWSPHQEGPLTLSTKEEDMMLYYKAHQNFARAVKHSQDKFMFRLSPGELLAVNNRKTLHGRLEYQLKGGLRWLKGCYVLYDHLINQIKVLSLSTGDKRPIKNVGYHM